MKNRPFLERLEFALSGISAAWRSEASFRTQIIVMIGVLLALLWLRPAAIWWAMTVLAIGAVLAAELFNTALEHVIDHLHPEHAAKIKIAKDCAAGAVLVLCVAAIALFLILLMQT
ncbi:diacylglycerol kinase [Crenobacter sp. SG2305]|uniref:diacylglycerol kinase n=1 Tax=Crenobacter oryzisoli TaxID=3056844 RepID=UPI0025AA9843|nr:diacylglycerol kinase [Crenobacter sp. SG2305]MDN0084994.1 diacylglycerol kinase [Crenobacter sp. SG2305]